MLGERVDGHGAADDGVGSLGAEAGHVVAPLLLRRCELVDDLRQALDRQLVPVQPADRIAARLAIDFCQIAQRAAGPDEPIARRQSADTSLGQTTPDVVAQALQLFEGRRIRLEKLLAQPERPERQAHLFPETPARELGDLHAPAAEIEQQAVRHGQASYGSGETVASFRQPADGLHVNAQLALQTLGEDLPVRRVAHRRGGHGDDTLRSGTCRDRLKIPQRFGGPRHRRIAELAALVDVVHQPQRSAGAGEQAEVAG